MLWRRWENSIKYMNHSWYSISFNCEVLKYITTKIIWVFHLVEQLFFSVMRLKTSCLESFLLRITHLKLLYLFFQSTFRAWREFSSYATYLIVSTKTAYIQTVSTSLHNHYWLLQSIISEKLVILYLARCYIHFNNYRMFGI